MYVCVSVYMCLCVTSGGICYGGGHGAGKGLHCHSGMKFSFIFLHIFCQERHVLWNKRPQLSLPGDCVLSLVLPSLLSVFAAGKEARPDLHTLS